MSEKSSKREWVKSVAIIFLLILLILTFFSNTIMNRTLPQVASQMLQSGNITAKVRGTGKVESVGLYEVKAELTREIRAVMVKTGQEVNEGDVLFVLGDGTSEEVKAATEKLRELQLSYQKQLYSGPAYDYSLENYQIEMAELKLQEAQEAEQKALEELQAEVGGIGEGDIKAAEAEYNTKKDYAAQMDLDYYNKLQEVKAAEEDYDAKAESYNDLVAQLPEDPEAQSDPQYDELRKQIEAAEALWRSSGFTLDGLRKEAAELESQCTAANAEAEAANTAWQDLILKMAAAGPKAEAYKKAVEARQQAEETLIGKRASLNQAQMNNGRAAAVAALELQDISEKIELAKQELALLTGGEENQITAKVGGTIQSINLMAGNTATKDSTLCTIEVPDMGYTLSFTCTKDQAKRIHTGDKATVSNFYWGSQIEATLVSIQNDPKDPQNSRILTFELKGDVTSGSELTISCGSKSTSYDVIVPNNAIRTDSNGTYVLKIEEKSSPMMNRYYAKRVSVEVLVSDDLNSAVTGDISAGDYVVTTSNVPVKSGDQIRFGES